jgi:hypothetical protein
MTSSVRILIRGLVALCLVVLVALPALAQAKSAAMTAAAPVLVTSCGQSPGPSMFTVYLRRLQIAFESKPDATAADIASKKYKAVIVVTGSSLKGMGAAGVSIDDEIARIGKVVAEAKKQGVTVIGAHVEGMERRAKNAAPGDNSDEMSIDAVCPKAQFLIVRKDGDEDGRFTAFAKKNIPVLFFLKNAELMDVLKGVFGK